MDNSTCWMIRIAFFDDEYNVEHKEFTLPTSCLLSTIDSTIKAQFSTHKYMIMKLERTLMPKNIPKLGVPND